MYQHWYREKNLPEFARSVVQQMFLNLKRVNSLGINKIGITGIQPIRCSPRNTATSSFKNCDSAQNKLSKSHNEMLKQSVMAFNYAAAAPVFIRPILYNAFFLALQIDQNNPHQGKLSEKLKPCCIGVNGEDKNNGDQKKYIVCEDPKTTFFWDKSFGSWLVCCLFSS
ncbi:hypothetical protein ABFX02_06G088500 [Erythranthe guttata]